jgi:hypothetical protein
MPFTLALEDVRSIEKWVEVDERDKFTAAIFLSLAVILVGLIVYGNMISDIPLD